jgi:hypothetical protein
MTTDCPHGDRIDRSLAGLARREPDAARADLVRARCHEALARRTRRERLASSVTAVSWRVVIESAVVGSICAVYLSDVLRRALALYGLLG